MRSTNLYRISDASFKWAPPQSLFQILKKRGHTRNNTEAIPSTSMIDIIKSSQKRESKGKGKIKILTQLQTKILKQNNKSRESSLEDKKIQFYWNTSLTGEKHHKRNYSEHHKTISNSPMNPSETLGSSSRKNKVYFRLDKTK